MAQDTHIVVKTDTGQRVSVEGQFLPNGQPAINTIGTATFAGLSLHMKVTTKDVTDVAAQVLLAAPTAGTNSILVHNTDAVNTLYISDNIAITADNVVGTTSGKEIQPGEEWGIDIKTALTLYVRAPAATTIRIKVTELG